MIIRFAVAAAIAFGLAASGVPATADQCPVQICSCLTAGQSAVVRETTVLNGHGCWCFETWYQGDRYYVCTP